MSTIGRGWLFVLVSGLSKPMLEIPTNALLNHCGGDKATDCMVATFAQLQKVWLQRAQHSDVLQFPAVSGVVRSLGKRYCIIVPARSSRWSVSRLLGKRSATREGSEIATTLYVCFEPATSS